MRLKGAGGLHDEQRGLEHFGYVGELVQLRLWSLEEDGPWNLVDECEKLGQGAAFLLGLHLRML